MRIALRTGGGRGDYELAGSQGNIHVSKLFGRPMYYELTPDLVIPARAEAVSDNGKPRIRLQDTLTTTHFWLLLAGILLLPKPIRDFKKTKGKILIQAGNYSIASIKIDVGAIDESRVIIRPTDLLLANSSGLERSIGFVERMARITALWEAVDVLTSPLAKLIQHHRDLVLAIDPDFKAIVKSAKTISSLLKTSVDPLPLLESKFGLIALPIEAGSPDAIATSTSGEHDTTSQDQATLENLRRWRKVAVRGAAAQRFRADIKSAYDFRCLFSGQRLPKLACTLSAGVDAAHILPWATHGINTLPNGICLSKLCHWAFDAGVLNFTFDTLTNQYWIRVPKRVLDLSLPANFDLAYFKSIEGPIDDNRFPNDKAAWPDPALLARMNAILVTGTI